jgi:hypothetical protein
MAKEEANGWLLSQSESKSEILMTKSEIGLGVQKSNLENQTSNYLILFWPQWLQYFGYVFLVGWFSFLIFIFFIKRK